MADNINRALSAATASHYALIAAVCCSMGFIPQLGFVHKAGTLPFIYDAAISYKHETSWPAAFEAISIDPKDDGKLVRKILKRNVEQSRMLQRAPKELKALFDDLSTLQEPKPHPPPAQIRSMTVIVANDVPAFIRGHLKRWFIEPRPNVFVGTLNVRTHDKVMQFIVKHAPPDFGFLSITFLAKLPRL